MHVVQKQAKKLQIVIRKSKDVARQTPSQQDKNNLILQKLEWF